MLLAALGLAAVLLAAIIVVVVRALDYLHRHPELIATSTPHAYERCHLTLAEIIARYKQIEARVTPQTERAWQSFNGRQYTVSFQGVEERTHPPHSLPYHLSWDTIGGVGLRMQPGFQWADSDRDGHTDNQYTTGYSFHLLIVPASGNTIDIVIPTVGHSAAVDFVAHTIALAERRGKRINVFGFDKPPAPHRQRVAKF